MRIGILCISVSKSSPFGLSYGMNSTSILNSKFFEILPEIIIPLRYFDYIEESKIKEVNNLFREVGEMDDDGIFTFNSGLRKEIFMPLWKTFLSRATNVSLEDFMSSEWSELLYLESPNSPLIVWSIGGEYQVDTLESFLRKGMDRCCAWFVTGCYSYHA